MRPQAEKSRRCHAVTHSYIIFSLGIVFWFKCLVIPIHIIINYETIMIDKNVLIHKNRSTCISFRPLCPEK